MCGLNGILRLSPDAPAVDLEELQHTRDAMAARGPDGEGSWLSPDGRIGLGHRRLAIIDLSPAGAQPMHSPDGRYTIVFNGEIYNHAELRDELEREGTRFTTTSDTEVLLQLFARDDLRLFERLEGMYAFALWDQRTSRLVLARDPFGIKPLYYATDGRTLRFASQVRALEAGRAVSRSVDPAGLAGFLLWGSVPEPFTLRPDVRALPAGHVLDVRAGRLSVPQPHPANRQPPPGTKQPAQDVAAAFERTLRLHLVSDVPVGVFLSAGIDSAVLAALATRALDEPPLTFTLSFEEFAGGPLDEAPGAAATAARLGTRHRETRVPRGVLDALWPRAVAAMDQPSIDGLNVYVVSHFARQAGLKVALSGLGGDELLGGYPSFRSVPRWSRWARRAAAVPGLPAAWPRLSRLAAGRRPKAAGLLRHGTSLAGAYYLRRGLFLPEDLPALVGRPQAEEGLAAYDPWADLQRHLDGDSPSDGWAAVQRLERGQYLRNQLLRDADWASMAHGLELRVPFVNASLWRAVAAARHEPARSQGKAAFARAVASHLPPEIFTRPKSGFMLPPPSRHGRAQPWGLASRDRAALVLRHFGVDIAWPHEPRGGTLFFVPEAFRGPGGIQRHQRNQVQALRRARPDAPLRVLVLNDTPAEICWSEWAGLQAEALGGRRAWFAWRGVRHAWRQQPDHVVLGHRNFLPLAPVLAVVAPRAKRWLLAYGSEMRHPLRRWEQLALRVVDDIYAISPQTVDLVTTAGYRGRTQTLACSLPPGYRLPSPSPPALQPPLRLLSVARLDASEGYKGIADVIAMLGHLSARGIAAELDVVGDGSDRARLERLAWAGPAPVRFHGFVSDASLERLYHECDVFVLPSTGEGFGIVFLEALAHAKPVVAADSGGAPFVVRPGQSGWLVPPGDPERLAACLARLCADPEATRRTALAGRRMIESEFTFDHLVERTRALLDAR